MPYLRWIWLFSFCWIACREEPFQWNTEEFPRVVYFSGERWPIPAESWIEILFSQPLSTLDGIYLIPQKNAGACNPTCPGICHAGKCFVSRVDENFLNDASKGVLSPSRKATTVELVREVNGEQLRLRPRWGSLWPAWRYDLVFTPLLQDEKRRPLLDSQGKMAAFALVFSTPPTDDLPAKVTWLAPLQNARFVPQNVAFLVLRLSGEGAVGDGIFILEDASGNVLELVSEPFAYGCVDEGPGCASVLLRIPVMLKSKTKYTLRVIRRVRLSDGRFLLPWMQCGEFTTGELSWLDAPTWQMTSVETITGCTHVKGHVTGQALVWLEDATGPRTSSMWVQNANTELGLAGTTPVRVHIMGLEGSHILSAFVTPSVSDRDDFEDGPILVRIFPNPLGTEPAQEFIEVFNPSDVPIELEGYELTDSFEKSGDVLPPYILAPGARVRVAGKGYTCDLPNEPPCDVDVVVLGSSLATGGLANAGEPLYLFDTWGRMVSRYGGWVNSTQVPGVSVWRVSPRACDISANWILQ